MATIKAFTDLPQSKVLAEFLPIGSADCYWEDDISIEFGHGWHSQHIPCWSLAALLELLPKRIEIVDNVYELSIYLYGIYYWNINNGNLCFESKDKDNLVDACYEAIVFLHEQKLSL